MPCYEQLLFVSFLVVCVNSNKVDIKEKRKLMVSGEKTPLRTNLFIEYIANKDREKRFHFSQ